MVLSIAIAKILSPFFRQAAFRTLAGITTCPLEETLVVDASTTTILQDIVRTFLLKSITECEQIEQSISLVSRWDLNSTHNRDITCTPNVYLSFIENFFILLLGNIFW